MNSIAKMRPSACSHSVHWLLLATLLLSHLFSHATGVEVWLSNGGNAASDRRNAVSTERRATKSKIFDMKAKSNKGKANKAKSKASKGMKSKGTIPTSAPQAGTTPTNAPQDPVLNNLYLNSTSTNLAFDILRLEGFALEDVRFTVTRSFQTSLDMSLPYATGDRDDIEVAFNAIADADVMDPDAYRRVFLVDVTMIPTGCSEDTCPTLNLIISESVQDICVGETCFPVLCPLTLQETNRVRNRNRDFSFAPSNNELFFGDNIDCTIVKPEFWDDYISTYFGAEALATDPPELLYYLDPDADGASNIVEFYGVNPMNVSASTELMKMLANMTSGRRDLQLATSTDPLNFDTDGDLLNDGFEIGFGIDPLLFNDLSLDQDMDGLTTFEEQRVGTDPFNPDSDSDGASDKTETDTGSDPNDDRDSTPSDTAVTLDLSVGDHSGSHSERYNMIVGTTTHEAPVFGEVRTASYSFPPGEYTVSVVWVASRLSSPDYDYYADISWGNLPEGVSVSLSDPQGIMGFHGESSFDFASGKTATLTIEAECEQTDPEEEVDCSCFKTCEECQSPSVPECTWVQADDSPTGFCRKLSTGQASRNNRKTCPCAKCQKWYEEQINDREWVNELPRCPCTVDDGIFGTNLRPVNDDNVDWSDDWACSVSPFNLVDAFVNCEFHKGGPGEPDAVGCIRASKTVGKFTYGQQCCYGQSGSTYDFLEPGLKSSGTPDRSTDWTGSNSHGKQDVDPYNWCCVSCTTPNSCKRYIGDKDSPFDDPGGRSDPRGCMDALP